MEHAPRTQTAQPGFGHQGHAQECIPSKAVDVRCPSGIVKLILLCYNMYMSEILLEGVSLREQLHPLNTPEIAFQSYKRLAGDKDERAQQRDDFLAGDVVNPTLDYPVLDENELRNGISVLGEVLKLAEAQPDQTAKEAIWDSAAYRMAEMYWLLSAKELIDGHFTMSEDELDRRASYVQNLNEQLYGKPDQDLYAGVVSEIWRQIDGKELVGVGQQLKQELEHGFVVEVAGKSIVVSPLKRNDAEPLKPLPQELLDYLDEKVLSDNPDLEPTILRYWDENVKPRPTEEQHFTVDDMYAIFSLIHQQRDPDNSSGIQVLIDPSATALSWETEQMAVVIGGKRGPISSAKEMLSKVVHEYIVHAGRAMSGIETDIPVVGTGLYTAAEPGEVSDYLTFEEGFASTCEKATTGEDTSWDAPNLERYAAYGLAYEGNDFRKVFETLWRARVLIKAQSGEEPTEKQISTAQNNTYAGCVRIFRGTPTSVDDRLSDGEHHLLTFNKDLAYLEGKQRVVTFWEKYKNDPAMLDLVFKAKFDPTNQRQLELVQKVFSES